MRENQLRDAKDEGVKNITDQQRKFGMVPNPRAAEDFVTPILEKFEREPAPAPKFAQAPVEEILPGQARRSGDGTQTAMGRKRGPDVKEGWTARTSSDSPILPATKVEDDITMARRISFKFMRLLPEWRERVEKVLKSVDAHKSACDGCKKQGIQRCTCIALQKVLDDFNQWFRDPLRPQDPKIYSIAKAMEKAKDSKNGSKRRKIATRPSAGRKGVSDGRPGWSASQNPPENLGASIIGGETKSTLKSWAANQVEAGAQAGSQGE